MPKDIHPEPSPALIPPLVPTGVAGFDVIMGGGLPEGRMYLIEGPPGTGKTTFGLQFLREGAARGESTLYVTLSQTSSELEQIAASHGFDLSGVHIAGLEDEGMQLSGETSTVFHSGHVDLVATLDRIRELVSEHAPARVVLDSAAEIRLLAQDGTQSRRQFLLLREFFAEQGPTVLLLDDETARQRPTGVHSIMHGVIRLEQHAPTYGPVYRRLRIHKLRGMPHPTAYEDFRIVTGGIELFPTQPVEAPLDERHRVLHSGVESLDALVGGGLDFGSSAVLLGVAGTGKSSLASLYAAAAAEQGIPVAMYTFDERRDTVLVRSDSLGLAIREHVEAGRIELRELSPAHITAGELTFDIREAVRLAGVRVVVIDSLTGYVNSVPPDRRADTQLHDLMMYLGRAGVLTLLTVPQHGLVGALESQLDISYLADTVFLLRHYEATGQIRKAIAAIKRRRGGHDPGLHDLLMSSDGIAVGPRISNYQGVLTGVPAVGTANGATSS